MDKLPIENRIANNSTLIQIDLDDWVTEIDVIELDLSEGLFQGLVLREKEFRVYLKEISWEEYQDKNVLIVFPEGALVQKWAYMLVASKLLPFTSSVFTGVRLNFIETLLLSKIKQIPLNDYVDKKVVVKGCSKYDLSAQILVDLILRLQPVVSSIMFGEPCSTVPVFKKKKSL